MLGLWNNKLGVIPTNDEIEEIIWRPEGLDELPMKELYKNTEKEKIKI